MLPLNTFVIPKRIHSFLFIVLLITNFPFFCYPNVFEIHFTLVSIVIKLHERVKVKWLNTIDYLRTVKSMITTSNGLFTVIILINPQPLLICCPFLKFIIYVVNVSNNKHGFINTVFNLNH